MAGGSFGKAIMMMSSMKWLCFANSCLLKTNKMVYKHAQMLACRLEFVCVKSHSRCALITKRSHRLPTSLPDSS